jgi:bacterioferritin (cytochrome b1)
MDDAAGEPELDPIEEAPARRSAPPRSKSGDSKLVALLNQSLGWELRAQAMYAHYAAYVKGLESITLAEHFEEEVTESLGHAKQVRDIIAALGGEAISTRDAAEIVHTEDTRAMLEEALKTESAAAAAYRKIIPLVKDHPVFYHAIYHILKDETAAVIEVETLLGR